MAKRHRKLSVKLPELTAIGMQRAAELAGGAFGFDTDSGPISKPVAAVTTKDVAQEAQRIASIADAAAREKEVFQTLASFLDVFQKSQKLAVEFLQLGQKLETSANELRQFLTALQQRPDLN